MITVVVMLLVLVVVGNAIFLVIFSKRLKAMPEKKDDSSFALLLQQMNELNRTMDQKITENSKQMNETVRHQYGDSQKLIQEINKEMTKHLMGVTQGLTKLDETNKQVVSFTDQLRSLQDMLKNPKHRGVLGEYYLETLLKNVLPPGSYEMQYKLGFDEEGRDLIVDAAVFVKDKIIPVDSKFSLENYNRLTDVVSDEERLRLEKLFVNDLKRRILETAKYIQPTKNTLDFAFMFIPHEAIYYDLLINKIGGIKEDNESLIQQAASKYHVIIVSPTSFLAYLQTVLQALNALKIEESAKTIITKVGDLAKHLKAYEDYQVKVGNALKTTVNQFTLSHKEFRKIDKDVLKITGETMEIADIVLERPETDE
jgi:DNA recombination protein RmuC